MTGLVGMRNAKGTITVIPRRQPRLRSVPTEQTGLAFACVTSTRMRPFGTLAPARRGAFVPAGRIRPSGAAHAEPLTSRTVREPPERIELTTFSLRVSADEANWRCRRCNGCGPTRHWLAISLVAGSAGTAEGRGFPSRTKQDALAIRSARFSPILRRLKQSDCRCRAGLTVGCRQEAP